MRNQSLDIATLLDGYRSGRSTPMTVMRKVVARLRDEPERRVWISRLPDEQLLQLAEQLQQRDPATLPLYGVPFAIKDNIDLAGLATTAACPAFSYLPPQSATAVQRLIAAGAIPVGKTNLDQFATGLVGTRSPYGACLNSFDPEYISGGSSSGSAVAVATGLVSFALGTDTAGSGRVPAAFNNVLGYKPTCGLISPRGMVPACRSLDTISVFGLCAADAALVGGIASGFDAADPYSRAAPATLPATPRDSRSCRYGIPRRDQLQFFGCEDYARAWDAALARLAGQGMQFTEIDLAPFFAVARLLYEGPWVAERFLAVKELLDSNPEAMWPVTREICARGRDFSAADTFRAQYRLAELRRECAAAWQGVDVLVTPTAGAIHRVDAVRADPIQLNTQLGYYTNFVNLLDLAAVAVPAGLTGGGLPFGVTLLGPAWSDTALLTLADSWHRALNDTVAAMGLPVPATPMPMAATSAETIDVAVCGAHLQGLPLNWQLTERGATLRQVTKTAPAYALHALPGGPPFRPGLVRVTRDGGAIDVEVWSVPAARFGSFVAGIPAPLGIGKLELADGRWVCGFLCEGHAVQGTRDITALGGWRAWLRQGGGPAPRPPGGEPAS
jgi:allophanate hydrolase